jgi:hypothetical protein
MKGACNWTMQTCTALFFPTHLTTLDIPCMRTLAPPQHAVSSGSFGSDNTAAPSPTPRAVRCGVIDPSWPAYRAWWAALIAAAAASGFFVPWEIAFGDLGSVYAHGGPLAMLDTAACAVFMADVGA